MNRRNFLKNMAAVGCAAAFSSCANSFSAGKGAQKPNIIFLLTDDQGWGDSGVYGHPYVETPNIDRLAREGTRFNQFYVNATVCAPSRVAFMTGRFPARENVHTIYFTDDYNRKHQIPPYLDADVPTIADLMKSEGYVTGHIGKWHLCGRVHDSPKPSAYGFDNAMVSHGAHSHPLYHKRWKSTDHPVTRSSHWIISDGIDFVEENKGSGKPFYLNLWTLVPHAPLLPTKEELAEYDGLEANPEDFSGWMKEYGKAAKDFQKQMKIYCAAMTSLDKAIGKLLDYLDKEGLAEDTLIVFTSDNGPEDYHIGNAANAGVGSPGIARGRKRSIYEGGIKVPCIVRYPGNVPAARVSESLWSGVDLMPTLASIIGGDLPNPSRQDGEDVSDIWMGRERKHRKDIFWEWKFEVVGKSEYTPPQLAVRTGDWKLLCNPDGSRTELYNILKDPSESDNLSEKFPNITKKLKRKVLEWKKTIPEKYIYED